MKPLSPRQTESEKKSKWRRVEAHGENKEMMQSKREYRRSGVNQMEKMRRRGSDNGEKLRASGANEEEMMRRRTNGGPVWQQDVLCACQSLTEDQDLCDTSVLNL